METLTSELHKTVQGSLEVISKAGSVQVPSWRFPGRLATSLNIEEVLKDEVATNNTLHLELIVDRLLLMLQCSVHILEKNFVSKSGGLPMTIGSTVKRLSKCILRTSSSLSNSKEELSLMQKKVAQLKLEIQNQHHQCVDSGEPSAKSSNDGNTVSKADNMSSQTTSPTVPYHETTTSTFTQTTETVFAPCIHCSTTHCTIASSAKLLSEQCTKLNLHSELASTDWMTQTEIGGLDLAKFNEAFAKDMETLNKSRELNTGKRLALHSENELLLMDLESKKSELQKCTEEIGSLKITMESIESENKATLARSESEFTMTLANLEEIQATLRANDFELRMKLNASQREVANLKVTMVKLEATKEKLKTNLQHKDSCNSELISMKEDLDKQLNLLVSDFKQAQEILEDQLVELNKLKVYNTSLENKHKVLKDKQAMLLSQLDEMDQECSGVKEELIGAKISREKLLKELQEIAESYDQIQQELLEKQKKLLESNIEQEKLGKQLAAYETELEFIKEQLESEKSKSRLLMDFPVVTQTDEAYADYIASLVYQKLARKQITANTVRIFLLEEQNNELRYLSLKEGLKKRASREREQPKPELPLKLWENDVTTQVVDRKDLSKVPVEENTDPIEYPPRRQSLLQGKNSSLQVAVRRTLEDHKGTDEKRFSSKLRIPTSLRSYSSEADVSSSLNLKGNLGHLMQAIETHRSNSTSIIGETKDLPEKSKSDTSLLLDSQSSDDIVFIICDKCDKICYGNAQDYCSNCNNKLQ